MYLRSVLHAGKRTRTLMKKSHSTGISNVSNAAVDDRFFEKHEYNALTPDQKNTLRLNRLKRGHVGNSHTGTGNNNGKNNGKGDKFNLLDDDEDEDESSDEEEGTSNRSNASLTRQNKKKKLGNN
jgi:hypothetical protein